jgi:hypothetical protein
MKRSYKTQLLELSLQRNWIEFTDSYKLDCFTMGKVLIAATKWSSLEKIVDPKIYNACFPDSISYNILRLN